MQFRSYPEFYREGPYAPYLTADRPAGSGAVRLLRIEQPAGDFPDPPMPEFFLYVALRGARELSFDWGCGRWCDSWHADDVSIAPPDVGTRIHVDSPHAFLAASLPKTLVTSALDDLGVPARSDLGALHTATFRNAFIVRRCRSLWSEVADTTRQDDLRIDGLILSILAVLAHNLDPARVSRPPRLLDRRRLDRVVEHVEGNMAQRTTLAELASVAGLSPMHFARQFRRTTGRSPHQFLLHRRLRRASLLLSTTGHALVDIAAEVGFSSQAHMTAIFSRHLKVTPARYRTDHRS